MNWQDLKTFNVADRLLLSDPGYIEEPQYHIQVDAQPGDWKAVLWSGPTEVSNSPEWNQAEKNLILVLAPVADLEGLLEELDDCYLCCSDLKDFEQLTTLCIDSGEVVAGPALQGIKQAAERFEQRNQLARCRTGWGDGHYPAWVKHVEGKVVAMVLDMQPTEIQQAFFQAWLEGADD